MFSDRRKRDMTNHGGQGNNKYLNNYGRGGGGGGGGGGSMVVLSRPRSSQNAGQKLSVPPPLNLPSLRKEHERVDSSGSSFLSGGGISGSGARPASSGMGWSKPAADRVEGKLDEPSLVRTVEKVSTLRGEDFPSLKASLPSASASEQRHKDGLNQKQKREEFPKETRGSALVDVRPQNRFGNEEISERPSFSDGLHSSQQVRRKEYLPGPLPIVRVNPRSDWADDERDTSHGLRDRDYGYSKNEPVREANAWRVSSPLQNEVANNNNNINNRGIYGARPSSRGRDGVKKSNYVLSGSRENVWNNSGAPYQHGGGRQPWNNNNINIDHQNRDKRPFFKSDKTQVEDHFMKDFGGDSVFDVHDPFPVLGVAKKKKEAFKQTEFHDPVRESFEAELERVQKMQEEERRRIIEEQERVIELVRTEEEERLRLVREQDEQQSRLEEEAREAAVRNEQERLEAARRAEELRKSKEEEKHKLMMEEERRKQAAKQKLLELEEKISRRQAEATAKGCSNNSSTVSEDVVKEKECADVDWEDSERMVDRITTSSVSRDGSFGLHKPFWRKEEIESGGNSRFVPQNMENVPHSPQRDVGEGFPKEFFGTAGYVGGANSYFKPGFPEHSADQSWRTPGDGRSYGARNYGMEPEPRENFGEQYGNPGWGQSQSRGRRGGAYAYPEKLYPNHEEDDYYPFGRPRYSVKQPRVLPPPQEKLSFRREVEHPGPSTSVGGMSYSHTDGGLNSTVLASYIGDLQDHRGMDDHRFDSKLTGRCDSQSSLSITSTPDSLVHISHDDLDESANSSVLVSSRKGDDAGKDSLMISTGPPESCWDNEEWTLDSNERLQEQEEYDEDEDGYQEEDKPQGVDENIDLTQELEELHLQEKDSNLVLGFNEGVEVEIPSDDLEKRQHPVSLLDGERPSVETSCSDEQAAAKPVESSDQVSRQHNASTSFQDTETTVQNSTVSTHLLAPPYSIGLHQSHVPSTSAQMEDRVKFQFGLFSGPSLIPSPFPAIQIGSIQMPLPLDPQFGSSLTHIQQPQSPFIQFGQLGYTSLITQGVLPPPPPPHSVVQANYALNQNLGSMATSQLRNAAAPASNPQISVLRRPVDVSGGSKQNNANISPASGEAAVPPHKQGEFSGKSESASRKMSHGRSNFADRQSGGQVVRNSGGTSEVSRGDSGGYRRYQRQRVEFRVRESNWPSEENRNGNGKAQNSTRNGSRKYVVSKSQKHASDSSVSGSNGGQKVESPSDDDDDDFIEVRSKRQMLNDRREQREKEKSQASKASRKPRSTLQNSTAAARSNRSPPAGRVANTKQISSVSNRQLLAPIGTPSPKTDSHADEKSGSSRDIPDQNPASSFVFSNKNKVLENIQTSVGTWSNQLTDQPVMALTQSQLDEAMKPASLLSCVSVENGTNRINEPNPKSTSVDPKNNTFPSPIKSLLAEGKIQFGAVTSPSVIPPCGERTENNTSLYFEKDRNSSSTGMEICEAEAAASAIAVAAITSDDTGGSTGSVLPPETKIYGGTSGTVGEKPSQSKAEESLIVSLPADLSVDTPISLWPPVPSPHNSNQMITHFPPAPPHFPFYDMNPMLRGPIYAFGPHHDSGANQQPQSQKGPGPGPGPGTVSGPPTTWQQQGHSGVDSFYAPAGFTGPFLTPPGAMPGVQGPPHMFVYNHFAPVGQFGGLSFMGTTYIPSGKQPDWKHNPMVSSSPDGDVNNPNVSPMQCNVVPASLQHLAMPSPLAMFEPSPFQSSSSQEMPVRARWPYMPFPGHPTMQIQNQQEAVDGSPSQFNNNNMIPPPANRYPNIQTADAVDSSNSYGSTSQPKPIATLSDPNSNNTQNPAGPTFKQPPPQQQQSSQEKNTQSQHVGGSSHHNQHQHQHNRRSGFHGRNQGMTRERGYHNNTKVKQIYVAKQSSSNSNATAASASSNTTTSPSI